MRDWEKATWASGQTETEVIRRVGEAIAKKAMDMTRPGDLILLLSGKGHNGDDVRAAGKFLTDRQCAQLDVTNPQDDLPKLQSLLSQQPTVVLDGLFGLGLNRPLSPDWVRFIDCLNESQCSVFSVDVPSGLDAETGKAQGAAIRAQVTLTVGAPKRGLLSATAWQYVGRLEVAANVGLIPCPTTSELRWNEAKDFAGFPPHRKVAGHKGSYGHVGIIAGSTGFHGAAILASRGAQRAQPGLVTLYALEGIYQAVASQLQAVMVSPWKTPPDFSQQYTGILVGPGLAGPDVPAAAKKMTQSLWRESSAAMIVDASALAWLPAGSTDSKALRLITPHPGEAARLLETTSEKIQSDRVGSLRALSKKFGNCWVVLKGHQTLIGRSDGAIVVNSTGNPHLAQGGSGDLLSGYLAGLLAQPELQHNPQKTIAFAVWQHGLAADRLQAKRTNWVIEDLAAEIGRDICVSARICG
jgi:ADP-dependent NAD(P)H-hydrate dehydratase / NAD(P)H-hydrate epimerase